ncbi:ABC transporter permease, partial [Bacillus thuringiensis]
MLWNECLKIVNKRIFILSHIGFIVMTVLFSWAYTSNLKADDTVAQMVNALLGL